MDKKKRLLFEIAAIVLVLAGASMFQFMQGSRGIAMKTTGEALAITGPENFSIEISYESLVSVRLLEEFDPGEALDAVVTDEVICGSMRSETYGEYTAAVTRSIESWILVDTTEGRYLLNFEDPSATRALCQALEKQLS